MRTFEGACRVCGVRFTRTVPRGPMPSYCSRDCYMVIWHSRHPITDAVRELWRLRKAAVRLVAPDYVRGLTRRTAAAYRRRHPDRVLANINRRRAARHGNGGSHTADEWTEKCALLGNVCIYCGEARPLTRDHKVPLSRGGTDDIGNVVPACSACNTRKGGRTAYEFLAA